MRSEEHSCSVRAGAHIALLLGLLLQTRCGRTGLDVDGYPIGSPDGSDDATTDGSSDSPSDSTTDAGKPDVAGCASSCDGCCTSNGECIPVSVSSFDVHHCGQRGEICNDCGDPDAGWQCDLACFRVDPGCSPANCVAGCCWGAAFDRCALGTGVNACGTGGEPCALCAQGEQCVPQKKGGGLCNDQSTCNSQSCGGCCYQGVCAMGTEVTACGKGGVACQNCTFVGNHVCTDAGTCLSDPDAG